MPSVHAGLGFKGTSAPFLLLMLSLRLQVVHFVHRTPTQGVCWQLAHVKQVLAN